MRLGLNMRLEVGSQFKVEVKSQVREDLGLGIKSRVRIGMGLEFGDPGSNLESIKGGAGHAMRW